MDRPALPPLVPGHSALPAFASVEDWVAERLAEARADTAHLLDDARLEAGRIRDAAQAALAQVVLDAEREAMRGAADEARGRLADARRGLERWVEAAEARLEPLIEAAVERFLEG